MCVFCEIAARKRPAEIVYTDAICTAFLDADPIAEGHVLLIPNAHYLDADDMPQDVFVHLMCVSRRILSALKRAYRPAGYSMMQNGGAFNDVGHYHLHIFPRNENDGFGWTSADTACDVSSAVASRIRAELE